MQWRFLCTFICCTVIYTELFADYMQLFTNCAWPQIQQNALDSKENVLHAMILADIHLIGPIRGHWLDRLYREWHMSRAFQAGISIFKPDVIFILGDIFDEGEFVQNKQFNEYMQRFHRQFRTPEDMPIVSAVGNHDIGFHYKLHPFLVQRFENNFNNTGVSLYTFKGVHFVFINSMAMDNDGCYFCLTAEEDLRLVSAKLNCLKNSTRCKNKRILDEHKSYSRPILMQHFPTYRISDARCKQRDEYSPKLLRHREKWEVLSKQSTDLLNELLVPRLAFSGHLHHYCLSINRMGIEEHTLASFNWRNKINPSFMLGIFTPDDYAINKCDMLQQNTVIHIYLLALVMCFTILVWDVYQKILARRKVQMAAAKTK